MVSAEKATKNNRRFAGVNLMNFSNKTNMDQNSELIETTLNRKRSELGERIVSQTKLKNGTKWEVLPSFSNEPNRDVMLASIRSSSHKRSGFFIEITFNTCVKRVTCCRKLFATVGIFYKSKNCVVLYVNGGTQFF